MDSGSLRVIGREGVVVWTRVMPREQERIDGYEIFLGLVWDGTWGLIG